MKALILELFLQSPLMVTGSAGGDVNSEVTLTYIPGSVLRGALVGLYKGAKDASDPQFRNLFLNGKVRYLNAYPVLGGERALPTPASWQRAKDAADKTVYDLALHNATGGATLKGVDKPFCRVWAGGELLLHEPEMQIDIHIARSDRQRPTADGATIFRYDSLTAGQTFAAAIVADDADTLAPIAKLLAKGSRLRIGRSRSAQYGNVAVVAVDGPKEWQETPATTSANGAVVVTLLSDAFVRDPNTGAYTASLRDVAGAEPTAAFVRTRLAGGFNQKWNLPLAQALAIEAGSVFVFPASAAKRLQELVEQGIGERTAEGFGRIAVGWQQVPELHEAEPAKPGVHAGSPDKITAPDALAMQQHMVDRLLRTILDRRLVATAGRLAIQRNGMTNTQLSRLRVVVRDNLAPAALASSKNQDKLTVLTDYLGNVKRAARDPLERARIERKPLMRWLQELAADPQGIWAVLEMPLDNQGESAMLDVETRQVLDACDGRSVLRSDHAYGVETSLRLIDALARKAIKEGNNA